MLIGVKWAFAYSQPSAPANISTEQAVPINTPGPAVELVLSKQVPSNATSSKPRQLRIGMRVTEGLGAVSTMALLVMGERKFLTNCSQVSTVACRHSLSSVHRPQRHQQANPTETAG